MIKGFLTWLTEALANIIEFFGEGSVVALLVVGIALIVTAILLARRVQNPEKDTGLGARIVAVIALSLGIPFLFLSLGVGTADAVIWGLLALAIGAFWLAGEPGKRVTVIGILIGILALVMLVFFARDAGDGSLIASSVLTVAQGLEDLWNGATAGLRQ